MGFLMQPSVLVVDDELDIREVLAEALGYLGLPVHQACSGLEAQAKLEANPSIGAIITDLQMPNGNGIDLIERIRASGRPMLVVAISGGSEAWLAAALGAGADVAIAKPFDFQVMTGLLAEHFAKAKPPVDAPAHAVGW